MPASVALGAPQATEVADRFHIVKNLTETLQLLVGRSLEEIKATSQTPKPDQDEPSKRVVAVEEWRPPEPAHVQKARLARRTGRYARSQQVVELQAQGMKPKQIAQRLGISQRTIQRWLASGTFPEARKRREAGKAALMSLRRMSFPAGKRGRETVWLCGGKSRNKAIQEQGEPSTASLQTLKQAEVKASTNPQRLQKFSATTAVWLGCRVIGRAWMRWNKRIWPLFVRPAHAEEGIRPHSRFLVDGPEARGISTQYVVRAGQKLRSLRTPIFRGWG